MNNQHQIGLAISIYSDRQNCYPGYVSSMNIPQPSGTITPIPINWWISILPDIEGSAFLQAFKEFEAKTRTTFPGGLMRIAVCPSGPPAAPNVLHYRVNVGRATPNYVTPATGAVTTDTKYIKAQAIPAEGVFANQLVSVANEDMSRSRISQSFISSKDGTTNTLMLAENSATVAPPGAFPQDGIWWNTSTTSPFPAPCSGIYNGTTQEGNITTTTYQSSNDFTVLGFNWCGIDPTKPYDSSNMHALQKIYSNHPQGSYVTFCGENTAFLRADIDQLVYLQLMCPWDAGVYTGASPEIGIRNPIDSTKPCDPFDETNLSR